MNPPLENAGYGPVLAQSLLNVLTKVKKTVSINVKKTEYVVTSKKKTSFVVYLHSKVQRIKEVSNLK